MHQKYCTRVYYQYSLFIILFIETELYIWRAWENSPMPQSTQLEIQSNICFKKFHKFQNISRVLKLCYILWRSFNLHWCSFWYFVSNFTNRKIIFWLKKCDLWHRTILTQALQLCLLVRRLVTLYLVGVTPVCMQLRTEVLTLIA